MDWFKKHADTALILAAVCGSLIWINSSLNEVRRDVVIIKTVLIMKQIMPTELCHKEPQK